jgi:hypothetical protein
MASLTFVDTKSLNSNIYMQGYDLELGYKYRLLNSSL